MIRTSTHKARKDYICAGCEKPIKAGDKYAREVYKIADLLISDAVHMRCKQAEILAGIEGWYCAFSGEKIRAISFQRDDMDKIAAIDQDMYIAIWGAG